MAIVWFGQHFNVPGMAQGAQMAMLSVHGSDRLGVRTRFPPFVVGFHEARLHPFIAVMPAQRQERVGWQQQRLQTDGQ